MKSRSRFFALLISLILVGPASLAVTLTGIQLSRSPGPETCAPPPAATSFRVTDTEIWGNFAITDGLTGDVARVEWLDPTGAIIRTVTFTALPGPGAYCFDAALSRAGNTLVPQLGTWTVRLVWNGASLATRLFTVAQAINVTTLQLGRSGPDTCTPPPAVTSFRTTDIEIWAYLGVGNALAGDRFTLQWIGPNGAVAFETPFQPVPNPGGYCFVDYLSTATDRYIPATGTWTLGVVLNGARAAMVAFSVTSENCTFSVSPGTVQLPAGGGSGTVQVTAAQGCAWTAVSTVPWVSITSGSSGSGNGTVNYSAAQNPDAAQRSGNLNIAGQIVVLTQAGGGSVSCSFTLAPTSASVPSAGGTGSFSVNASAPGCAWSASSNASWISITSGSSGTGNGTVGYSASGNVGSARSGTITAAGRTFTLNQAGPPVSGGPPPKITAGVNAASYMPASLPAGEIARGSIFTIFGDDLGPALGVRAESYPIGTSLAGVTITVRQGATTVNVLPIYVSDGQINAIMPSNAPLGDVQVTVTYNGVLGTPFSLRVSSSNFGAFSVSSSGLGPGIIQNFNSPTDQPLNSAAASARPRQVAILWGTGLGAISGPDNIAPPAGDLPGPVEILVGGKLANKLYAGRAPCCAAEDQIVFEVPADAPEGCFVPVHVRTGGNRYSNAVTMAIERNGQRCVHTTQAGEIGARGGKVGSILLLRIDALAEEEPGMLAAVTVDLASAAFEDLGSGGDFAFNPAYSQPPLGSCLTFSGRSVDLASVTAGLVSVPGVRELDAGNELTIAGPSRTMPIPRLDMESTTGPYFGALGGQIPGDSSSPPLFFGPGSFTVRGPGGRDVGAFQVNTSITAIPVWTNRNQIASIDRAGSTTITWSGGDPATQVALIGGAVGGAEGDAGGLFVCAAPISDGRFTIPPSALANLPATLSEDDLAALFFVAAPKAGASFSAPGLDAGYVLFVPFNLRTVTVR